MADKMRSLMKTFMKDFEPLADTPDQQFQSTVDFMQSKRGMELALPTTTDIVDLRLYRGPTYAQSCLDRAILRLALVLFAMLVLFFLALLPSDETKTLKRLANEGIEVQGHVLVTLPSYEGRRIIVIYPVAGEGDYKLDFTIEKEDYSALSWEKDSLVPIRYLPDDPTQARWVGHIPSSFTPAPTVYLPLMVLYVAVLLGLMVWVTEGRRKKPIQGRAKLFQIERIAVLRLPHPKPRHEWIFAVVILGQTVGRWPKQQVISVFRERMPSVVPEVGGTVAL